VIDERTFVAINFTAFCLRKPRQSLREAGLGGLGSPPSADSTGAADLRSLPGKVLRRPELRPRCSHAQWWNDRRSGRQARRAAGSNVRGASARLTDGRAKDQGRVGLGRALSGIGTQEPINGAAPVSPHQLGGIGNQGRRPSNNAESSQLSPVGADVDKGRRSLSIACRLDRHCY
jgi:hypothetical protein